MTSSWPSPAVPMQDLIRFEQVTKRFPGVIANHDIDLAIRAGEVHVLLGENGAGKSTLVSLLSGLQQPSSGRILVDGAPVRIRSPRHALELGIGSVFQHVMLVPSLSVSENLLLGGKWWQRPNKAEIEARAAELGQVLGFSIDLHAKVVDLSLGEQQQVEILRALLREIRVLILDESTSMLTQAGIADLGALMRRLAAQGLAIIFITHKLDEAISFGDRISVLRRGRKLGEIAPERMPSRSEPDSQSTEAISAEPDQKKALITEIVELMFGETEGGGSANPRRQVQFPEDAPPLLDVSDLTIAASPTMAELGPISLSIRPGEIIGIAGMDGNGQKQLAEALAGQLQAGSGSVVLAGESLDGLTIGARHKKGLRYLTDDRMGEGTIGSFPVSINFFLKQIGAPPFWRHGLEQTGAIEKRAAELVDAYDIRTPNIRTPISQLSGGNIQKVLIARELAENARAVIFNKPTYGLDLANMLATRQRIRDVAAKGMAVLLISTDLEELLDLCDRIAVMSSGRLIEMIENSGDARARIGRLMIGLSS